MPPGQKGREIEIKAHKGEWAKNEPHQTTQNPKQKEQLQTTKSQKRHPPTEANLDALERLKRFGPLLRLHFAKQGGDG